MPSSSMSEACSIDRTPARMAELDPVGRRAHARRRRRPAPRASSTAASTSGSASSMTPGSVPRVRTAPVTMSLMTVGAARRRARGPSSRTSSAQRTTPKRSSVGEAESRCQPGHVAAATRARDEGAGALHPRARRPARVDRVAQGDVDERPERADVADRGEPGAQGGPGVAHAAHRLLGRRRRRWPGCRRTPARRSGGCGSRSARGRPTPPGIGRASASSGAPSSGPRIASIRSSSSTRIRRSSSHSRSRRRAGAAASDQPALGRSSPERSSAARTMAGMTTTDRPSPVHRRRGGRPPPRRPTRSPCSSASSSTSR